ncbi:hypothetical protein B0H14DRAFT_2631089 [Mycena olivaceomarginata]|nr:hypothetical protein B0H14DRAFT_2631089 [Mycena olivaceomarginata]
MTLALRKACGINPRVLLLLCLSRQCSNSQPSRSSPSQDNPQPHAPHPFRSHGVLLNCLWESTALKTDDNPFGGSISSNCEATRPRETGLSLAGHPRLCATWHELKPLNTFD